MVELRQAGRGEHHVERDLVVAEEPQPAILHRRGADQQADRRGPAQPREIDLLGQDLAQRVEAERIELVGRQQPRREFQRQRRGARHGAAEPHQRAGAADAPPEALEPRPRRCRPAFGQPVGEQHGVDRAGADAAHHVERHRILLQELVEHAPGESAEGAAALQRQRQRPLPGVPPRPQEGLRQEMGEARSRPRRRGRSSSGEQDHLPFMQAATIDGSCRRSCCVAQCVI